MSRSSGLGDLLSRRLFAQPVHQFTQRISTGIANQLFGGSHENLPISQLSKEQLASLGKSGVRLLQKISREDFDKFNTSGLRIMAKFATEKLRESPELLKAYLDYCAKANLLERLGYRRQIKVSKELANNLPIPVETSEYRRE